MKKMLLSFVVVFVGMSSVNGQSSFRVENATIFFVKKLDKPIEEMKELFFSQPIYEVVYASEDLIVADMAFKFSSTKYNYRKPTDEGTLEYSGDLICRVIYKHGVFYAHSFRKLKTISQEKSDIHYVESDYTPLESDLLDSKGVLKTKRSHYLRAIESRINFSLEFSLPEY